MPEMHKSPQFSWEFAPACPMGALANNPDMPDEVTPRLDLLAQLLAGRGEDAEPPGASR